MGVLHTFLSAGLLGLIMIAPLTARAEVGNSLSERDIQLMLIWAVGEDAEAGWFTPDDRKEAFAKLRKKIGSAEKGDYLKAREIRELKRLSDVERAKVGMRALDDTNTGAHIELPTSELPTAPVVVKTDRTEWKSPSGKLAAKTMRLTGADADMAKFYAGIVALPGRTFSWPPAGTVIKPDARRMTIEGEYGGRLFHIHARKKDGEVRGMQFSYPKTEVNTWRRVAGAMMSTFEPFQAQGQPVAVAAAPVAKPPSVTPTTSPRPPQVAGAMQTLPTDARTQADEVIRARVAEKQSDLKTGHLAIKKKVALVIGVGDYADPLPKLDNPPNDAADIKAELESLKFDVVYSGQNKKRDLEFKIQEFTKKLEGADVALLYYAGHGLQVQGTNYLLPADANINDDDDLDLNAIALGFILKKMEKNSPVNIVLLDACRNNPLPARLNSTINKRIIQKPIKVERGFAAIQTETVEGTFIAFATAPGRVADDGTGRNSPFTTALKQHLRTPGVSIQEMMAKVRRDVVLQTSRDQVPWESSSLIDTFSFNPK